MPTLLSINNYYYRRGGADVAFLEQNKLFEEIGWTTVPFSMQHDRNEATPWSEYFVDTIEFGEDYSLFEKLVRASKVIYSFESRQKLKKILDRIQPTVAHAHGIYHHISPSIFSILSDRGIPTVMTLHDLKLACPAYLMYTHDGVCERCKHGKIYNVMAHRCIKRSLPLSGLIFIETAIHRLLGSYSRHVDCFVSPSRFCAQKLVEWGWPASRFEHIPNFVHAGQFMPSDTVGSSFLYFGRLSREKGVDTLIKAVARTGMRLKIAGAGPQEVALKELAERTGADVEFLGYLSGNALHDAVRSARAVVLPSECYENAPISVLESYALAVPVIGAEIGGIPELIRGGETGFTFGSGDVDGLSGALAHVAALPDGKLAEMGRNARAWVARDFSAASHRDRLICMYKRLGADIP